MPPPVAEAFRKGVRRFVENPARLDAILASVERVAQQAYAAPGEGNEGAGG
jgi:FixJ family two-component response regulator